MKPYEFLPHTADVRIVARGKDISEGFMNAAYALTDVVTDHTKVAGNIEKEIKVESENRESLLYDWLEEFIVLIDSDGFLLAEIEEIKIVGNKLVAKVVGDVYSDKYETKTHVKAMTYQEMDIKEEVDNVEIKFIVDI